MARPIEVKAFPNFRIWLRYDDGTEGEADLSDLAGRGLFKAWNDTTFFSSVRGWSWWLQPRRLVVNPSQNDRRLEHCISARATGGKVARRRG